MAGDSDSGGGPIDPSQSAGSYGGETMIPGSSCWQFPSAYDH